VDPLTGTIASVGANLLGNLFGSSQAKKQERAAAEARARALAELTGLKLPTISEQQITAEMLQQQGEINPLLEQAISGGPSALEQISVDPRLAQAQMSALQSLQQMGEQGLTDSDRAMLNQITRQASKQNQARQGQILQEMQTRGVGGSGVELAARLRAAQEATERASQQGDELASMALQRKLSALSQAGNLGGNIRQQEFGEQEAIKRAIDAQNQFNIQNQRSVQSSNIAAQNAAMAANLAERQRIADTNVGSRNKQQQYNKELLQQDYLNRFNLAQARANALTGQAGQLAQQAQGTRDMWGNIGSTVGQGFSAYAQNQQSQKNAATQRQHELELARMNQFSQMPSASLPAATANYNNYDLNKFRIG
jgi:hypothetical protein